MTHTSIDISQTLNRTLTYKYYFIMEFVKFNFALFTIALSLLCSDTTAYKPNRIRQEIRLLREDISDLFDKTDQLNISANKACDRCMSDNKTSCPPVDGGKDIVMVNSTNVMVKYHSLIKAFVAEKKINRELQDQLRSMKDILSASETVANERDKELEGRLRSMEDIISDIGKNMTLMAMTRERTDIGRDRELESRLQSLADRISATESVARQSLCGALYCDKYTDGGGWIVFMRRQDGSENFTRSWLDYKHGFGSPGGEFWAGNELLHRLTKERPWQLRIDMEDFDGHARFAKYEEFQIGAEEDKYRLHLNGYSGTAGDSLTDTGDLRFKHAGMQFSAFDSDNDIFTGNCAKLHKGGWWYNKCFSANLNGLYSQEKDISPWKGIIWHTWTGPLESLKLVEMKVR